MPSHAALWPAPFLSSPKIIVDEPSGATGINGSGQIVGSMDIAATGETHAFLWDKGVLQDLGTLGGNISRALAINDAGTVTGISNLTKYGPNHAFVWEKGKMQDLGTLGTMTSRARAINASGQIVGMFGAECAGSCTFMTGKCAGSAFFWDGAMMHDLGSLGGGCTYLGDQYPRQDTHESATRHVLNDAGQVVGSSLTASGERHAFLWQNGTMTDLGASLGKQSAAAAINNSGQVVGNYAASVFMYDPSVCPL
jgi:probable HAF family extracellular repeat protein